MSTVSKVTSISVQQCAIQRGGIWNVKQMDTETRPEDSYRRCGGDVSKQTVPDPNSDN